MANDLVLTAETKRNEPLKYERAVWNDAIEKMKEITKIRTKRYTQLITNAQKPGKIVKKKGLIKKAQTKMHLIRAPVAEDQATTQAQTSKRAVIEMETE